MFILSEAECWEARASVKGRTFRGVMPSGRGALSASCNMQRWAFTLSSPFIELFSDFGENKLVPGLLSIPGLSALPSRTPSGHFSSRCVGRPLAFLSSGEEMCLRSHSSFLISGLAPYQEREGLSGLDLRSRASGPACHHLGGRHPFL